MLTKIKIAAIALMLAAAPAMAANPAWIASSSQAATTGVVALPGLALSNGVVLKADTTNTGTIYVGPCATLTTATGYPLKAGEAISYGVTNLAAICELGTVAGDNLRFTGN